MDLVVLVGSTSKRLGDQVAEKLAVKPGAYELFSFPDGELHVEVKASVRDKDVYLIQATGPPSDHLMELLLVADACRRARAERLTAVIPYLGYARQDRRVAGREAVGARVVAELIQSSGVRRVVAVDLHSPAIEGFFAVPLEHIAATAEIAMVLRRTAGGGDGVVVAPDLGATKLAERYGKLLSLPVAFVHKERLSGEKVLSNQITGDVAGRTPIIVDDMISTGGTIEAAVQALAAAGARTPMTVAATHALLVGAAARRLTELPVSSFVFSDSLASADNPLLKPKVVSLEKPLAEAIASLHYGMSLSGLRARG